MTDEGKRCEACKWWSERVVEANDWGPVRARCEQQDSPWFMYMLTEIDGCTKWEQAK